MIKIGIFSLLLTFIFLDCHSENWMLEQINSDLNDFKKTIISIPKLNEYFYSNLEKSSLLKIIINNNQITFEENIHFKPLYKRSLAIKKSLNRIASNKNLPNLIAIFCLNDGLDEDNSLPIFVMSKKIYQNYILIPDSEALDEKYQVLQGLDITKLSIPWSEKNSVLCWRGSTLQHPIQEPYQPMRLDNLHLFSRIKLCELSKQYPHLIDAGFTLICRPAKSIPYLQTLKIKSLTYNEMVNYKYQILIDGGVSSWSASGWRFLSGSLVFKPESYWMQWYYNDLKPYVDYIPVKDDLSDLLEKIYWAINHNYDAEQIAISGKKFALDHIIQARCDEYLYNLLIEYSKLNFKE